MQLCTTTRLAAGALAFVSLYIGGCHSGSAFPTDDELGQIIGLQNIHTPPRSPTSLYADSPAAAALGVMLFSDTLFSSCGGVACASCHRAPSYTVPLAFPPGCNGPVSRSVPTLLNTAFSDWYYWDGRKDSLWSHPIFPLLHVTELDADPQAVRQRMETVYSAQYQAAFGVAPTAEPDTNRIIANFGKAIEAYLRTLIKVDAPFDTELVHFIASAQAGQAESDPFYLSMKTFIRTGRCIICHKGPMLSDGSFHNLGLAQTPPASDHGHLTGIPILQADIFNGAGVYSDEPTTGQAKLDSLTTLTNVDLDGAFKTPTLRNVALTAPYFHTGVYNNLGDVVDFYDRAGDPDGTFPGTRAVTLLKLGLSPAEKQSLVDLLMSLTGSEQP